MHQRFIVAGWFTEGPLNHRVTRLFRLAAKHGQRAQGVFQAFAFAGQDRAVHSRGGAENGRKSLTSIGKSARPLMIRDNCSGTAAAVSVPRVKSVIFGPFVAPVPMATVFPRIAAIPAVGAVTEESGIDQLAQNLSTAFAIETPQPLRLGGRQREAWHFAILRLDSRAQHFVNNTSWIHTGLETQSTCRATRAAMNASPQKTRDFPAHDVRTR